MTGMGKVPGDREPARLPWSSPVAGTCSWEPKKQIPSWGSWKHMAHQGVKMTFTASGNTHVQTSSPRRVGHRLKRERTGTSMKGVVLTRVSALERWFGGERSECS